MHWTEISCSSPEFRYDDCMKQESRFSYRLMTLPLRWLLIGLALGLFPLLTTADDATGNAADEKIGGWIADLDAASRAKRVVAERELMALGPALLARLPRWEQSANPSTRHALTRIRRQLETQLAEAAFEASMLKLHSSMTPNGLSEAVVAQTGLTLEWKLDARQLPDELEISAKSLKFWELVREAAGQFERPVEILSLPHGVRLREVTTGRHTIASVSDDGLFLVSLKGGEVKPIPGDEQSQLMTLKFTAAVEPKLRMLLGQVRAAEMSVSENSKTGNRSDFPSFNPGTSRTIPISARQQVMEWSQTLIVPRAQLPKTLSINGSFTAILAARDVELKFPPRANEASAFGAMEARLLNVRIQKFRSGGGEPKPAAVVELNLTYEGDVPQLDSHLTSLFPVRLWLTLLDHDDKMPTSSLSVRSTKTGYTLSGTIPVTSSELGNAKLHLAVPRLLKEKQIDFEMRNVDLRSLLDND